MGFMVWSLERIWPRRKNRKRRKFASHRVDPVQLIKARIDHIKIGARPLYPVKICRPNIIGRQSRPRFRPEIRQICDHANTKRLTVGIVEDCGRPFSQRPLKAARKRKITR